MGRQSLYDVRRDSIIMAIKRLSDRYGKPPTLREVSELCDVSVATLHTYMPQLAEEGLITWQPRSHRSVRLTAKALETF